MPKAAKPKRPATRARAKRTATADRGAGQRSLRVKQVRSDIGHAETYRRTLRALGLRHHQHEITVQDTPSVRGMLRKVWHLVQVREEA